MKPSKTANEIIADALTINTKSAYAFRRTSDAINFCATALYTHYRADNGDVVPLKLVGGKYAAVYVRVSSERQKQDGWSVADQIKRGVQACLERKIAFRIFNDASLSGKLPNDDDALIKEMLETNAERYETAYRAVFFSDTRYNAEKPAMENWLSKQVRAIANGTESLADDYTPTTQNRKSFGYRPALTAMMEQVQGTKIHTLLLNPSLELNVGRSS